MKRVVGCFVCGVLVLLLAGATAWAQAGANAQISGTVRDSSGGVLPGVDVAVTQTDTGLKRNAANGSRWIGPHRRWFVSLGNDRPQRLGRITSGHAARQFARLGRECILKAM